jgi:hypothetical protein
MKKAAKWVGLLLAALAVVGTALVLSRTPSNDRDWLKEQVLLAQIDIEGDTIKVRNVRNVHYRSTKDFDVDHYDAQYSLSGVQSVWFIVEPFADWDGAAHTFISFGFEDGRYLAVSVELRKEKGESFDPLKGILRQYELIYVIADERDVIGLRANHRHDDVFLYKMRADKPGMQALLTDVLRSAEQLRHTPRFYNTLTDNCTTTIVDHVNEIVPKRIPFSYKVIAPGYSDELAFDLDLIETDLEMDQLRAHHRINEAAAEHADAPDFSARIRAGL